MLTSIRRVFIHGDSSLAVQVFSITLKPGFLQSNPFSVATSPAPRNPISNPSDPNNFIADYLANQLGFLPEKALSASKTLRFKSPEKPDAVIALLKNNGFTQQQIAAMVRRYPPLISCHPQNTLLPKIEHFRSSGISDTDITDIFAFTPQLFRYSLKKLIGPRFDCLMDLFKSNGVQLKSIKRIFPIFCCDFGTKVLPNVEILRAAGVGYSDILQLLQDQPRVFMADTERFGEVVNEVKQMGFDPSKFKFLVAVHALRSMTKSKWEDKLGVYMRWGLSREECIAAFIKRPTIMMKSEDYITKVMDMLINKLGFKASQVSECPYVMSYSFEKRVRPRCLVYEFLWENGLRKRPNHLPSFYHKDDDFLEMFVLKYEGKAPELLRLYEKEMARSKT